MNQTTAAGEGMPDPGVRQALEFTMRVGPSLNAMERGLAQLLQAGVQPVAYCLHADASGGTLRFTVADPALTRERLERAGLGYAMDVVVLVTIPPRLGMPALFGSLLRDAGIQIVYSYASWRAERGGSAVFKTCDDDRAVEALASHLALASVRYPQAELHAAA